MDKRNVIVGNDAVPQRGEAFLHALDHHLVREGIPQVLELLVRCRVGHKQPSLVSYQENRSNGDPRKGRSEGRMGMPSTKGKPRRWCE